MLRNEIRYYKNENKRPIFCVFIEVESDNDLYFCDVNFSFPNDSLSSFKVINNQRDKIIAKLYDDYNSNIENELDELADLIKTESDLKLLYLPDELIENNRVKFIKQKGEGIPYTKFWKNYMDKKIETLKGVRFFSEHMGNYFFRIIKYFIQSQALSLGIKEISPNYFVPYLDNESLDAFLDAFDKSDSYRMFLDTSDDERVCMVVDVNSKIKSICFFESGYIR